MQAGLLPWARPSAQPVDVEWPAHAHLPAALPSPRPPSKEELAARTQQVVRCDEAMRAVTLTQQVPGSKAAQQTRTYHFDKVRGGQGCCARQAVRGAASTGCGSAVGSCCGLHAAAVGQLGAPRRPPSQVFPPDTTQEKLYGSAIASIVEEVLEGFNCTIFAYGQTGTGKVCGGVAGSAVHAAQRQRWLLCRLPERALLPAEADHAAGVLIVPYRCSAPADAHDDGRHHRGAVGGRRRVAVPSLAWRRLVLNREYGQQCSCCPGCMVLLGWAAVARVRQIAAEARGVLPVCAGVIPRAIHQIFNYLDSINSEYRYGVGPVSQSLLNGKQGQ